VAAVSTRQGRVWGRLITRLPPMLMTIRDETATGWAAGSILLDVPGTVTVRALIRPRVREEVAHYIAQPTERFHGLVRPTTAEEDLNGHRMRAPARIDWERQADAAVTAFGRDGFNVLVADRQVEELDDQLGLDEAPMSRSSGWSRWSADDRHSHPPAPQSGEPVSRGRWHQCG
jgi:hypothetical protein